jgi:hypothetical protein
LSRHHSLMDTFASGRGFRTRNRSYSPVQERPITRFGSAFAVSRPRTATTEGCPWRTLRTDPCQASPAERRSTGCRAPAAKCPWTPLARRSAHARLEPSAGLARDEEDRTGLLSMLGLDTVDRTGVAGRLPKVR